MWQIHLTFPNLLFLGYSSPPWPFVILHSSHSVQLIFSILLHHISKLSRYSDLLSEKFYFVLSLNGYNVDKRMNEWKIYCWKSLLYTEIVKHFFSNMKCRYTVTRTSNCVQYSSPYIQHRRVLSKTSLAWTKHHAAFSYDTLFGCQDQNTTLHSATTHCSDVNNKTPRCIKLQHTAWMSRSKNHTAFS